MLVQEIMTKEVEIGRPDMSLQEVAKKMRDGDFGVMPVGENDRLVGMITDRDIVVRAVAEGEDAKQMKVREAMTEDVLYCFADEEVDAVLKNLGDNQIRRLPVLDRDKRLVGILAIADLMRSDADQENIQDALEQISDSSQQRQVVGL